uniref:Uncharacterized protein n=1 Tax=Timema genevievae TaxID=629358 RepID=A0A7R9PLD9_TIMGE|nr:unnamed protein product [Timema genevievae]
MTTCPPSTSLITEQLGNPALASIPRRAGLAVRFELILLTLATLHDTVCGKANPDPYSQNTKRCESSLTNPCEYVYRHVEPLIWHQEFLSRGVLYEKLMVPGRKIPKKPLLFG